MEQIMNYVKPELLIVAVVLYFIGMGIKKSEIIPDKYIPAILGALGILICGIYVVALPQCQVLAKLQWQFSQQSHREFLSQD